MNGNCFLKEKDWQCFFFFFKWIFFRCCCCLVAKSCLTLCSPMDYSMPGFPVLHYPPELFRFVSIESLMLPNHVILCHFLLLPSIFPSIKVFPSESVLHIRWPKYWSFSFSMNPSNEYSGLISFRMDWFALLGVQGTLKSHLQHNLKASIPWHSAFFTSKPHIHTRLLEKP